MSKVTLKVNIPTPLIKAVTTKNLKDVETLLMKNHQVTETDNSGNTPIHWACYRANKSDIMQDRTQMLLFLLKNLPRDLVDVRNLEGNTPLVVAIASGLTECVQLLIEKGANLHECGQNDLLPLTIACVSKDTTIIRLLVESGAGVNSQTRNGETTFHQIFKYWLEDNTVDLRSSIDVLNQGKMETILGLLLSYGADVNSETQSETLGGGETPLHYAAEFGCSSGVHFLLNHGAYVDEAPADRCTPLINAVFNGHRTTASILVDAGADYLKIMINGNCVLHSACSFKVNRLPRLSASIESVPLKVTPRTKTGKQNCVKYLLQLSKHHINLANDKGMTPLMCAAASGMRTSIVDILAAGAIVNYTDRENRTALHHVCMSEHNELAIHDIIECLINKGANVNAPDFHCDTPLHYLARRGLNDKDLSRIEFATTIEQLCLKRPSFFVLLTNEADVNAKGRHGNTPLHVACSYDDNIEVVKILVIMGAFTDIKNNDEQLPKDCASMWNRSYFEVMMTMGNSRHKVSGLPSMSQASLKVKKCIIS